MPQPGGGHAVAMWDCIVIGGGAAGLSATLVLGRAKRQTLMIDAGRQSNLAARQVGGLLGQDGRAPADFYAAGRAEVASYPGVVVRHGAEVVDGERTADGHRVTLADGTSECARRLLLATGMQYRPPELPGVAELWGKTVFHCPFCDGWEMRDRPLAVLARGEKALAESLMLRGWSDDVVLLTDGPSELDGPACERLNAAGVRIDQRPVARLIGADGQLSGIEFADGDRLDRCGLLAETTLHQRSDLADRLGARSGESTPLAQHPIDVDGMGRTAAPEVFAAGDVSAQVPQVAAAMSAGLIAATSTVQSLLAEDSGLPFPPWRDDAGE